jgi:hypothetical protein
VTRPLFAASRPLARFVQWKTGQGFNVGVLTLEWIDSHFPGAQIAEKTKAALFKIRQRWGLEYVLLVGDSEFTFPPGYTDGWCDPSGLYDLSKKWNVPTGFYLSGGWVSFSDFYYGDRHLFASDRQGHPCLASPCNLDFDLKVGRLAVRTVTELARVVTKTMSLQPASKVLSVISLPFAEIPDPCVSWPPAAGDTAQESAGYCTAPYAIDRALVGTGISHTSGVFDPSVPAERQKARDLIFNSDALLVIVSHGGRDGNEFFDVTDLPQFSGTVPFYLARSCLVNWFPNSSGDSLTESMLKAPKGAVLAAGPVNLFHFLQGLAQGKTVGEALFSQTKRFYGGGIALQDLLGDPSLRIFA